MAISGFLLKSGELGKHSYCGSNNQKRANMTCNMHLLAVTLSSTILQQDGLSRGRLLSIASGRKSSVSSRCNLFLCQCFRVPSGSNIIPVLKNVTASMNRSLGALQVSPILVKLAPAVGIILFAVWGVGLLMRLSRIIFHRTDDSWKKSSINFAMASYLQPLLLWTGAILVCRVLDSIILPTEASQAVKQRVVNFVRSLSSVLAFAYCFTSLIQQAQTSFRETNDTNDSRNMGFQFAGKAVYSAVWVAAVSLFMELLGFSTQKWLTAGGLGTVLLTLAGREIFTNFLSSVMIHATRPFVLNEWIQTKIEGYEVSGTVEHVGWWSPTIIRGDDREAIHIPNHKFTMNVVRNLSQKTHWRIKNYIAISHLDVNKINNIVADMRKVLAKNPLVEQQRLHRRVFLEYINPENQALMILVSCFVKTSHFEEYLCVKEAVMLDLLRVISHHRARLATPIRTVQRVVYGDTDDASSSSNSFSETIFSNSGVAGNRKLLLIDPLHKINGEDKTKVSSQTTLADEAAKHATRPVNGESSSALNKSNSDDDDDKTAPTAVSASSNVGFSSPPVLNSVSSGSTINFGNQENIWNDPSNGNRRNVKSVDISLEESASTILITAIEPEKETTETPSTISQSNQDEPNDLSSLDSTPPLEENIILGVALEGSKRTLPIEEHVSNKMELKEMAVSINGTVSTSRTIDKKDDQIQA